MKYLILIRFLWKSLRGIPFEARDVYLVGYLTDGGREVPDFVRIVEGCDFDLNTTILLPEVWKDFEYEVRELCREL